MVSVHRFSPPWPLRLVAYASESATYKIILRPVNGCRWCEHGIKCPAALTLGNDRGVDSDHLPFHIE